MSREEPVDRRLAGVVADVQIPLDNLAYTVEAYLMTNGARLDIETRLLLAGVRDCADLVASRVRDMTGMGGLGGSLCEDAPAAPVEIRRVANG